MSLSTNGEYRPPIEDLPIFDNSVFSYWDGFLTLRDFYNFVYSQIVGIYAKLAGNNIFTGNNTFNNTIVSSGLRLTNKNILSSVQYIQSGFVYSITFNTAEIVVIETPSIQIINLPSPTFLNIGAQFTIIRYDYTTPININPPYGQYIRSGEYDFDPYVLEITNSYITLTVVNSNPGGVNWVVSNSDYVYKSFVSQISSTITGGLTGQILYQRNPNDTYFLPNGNVGEVLMSNGSSTPSWSNNYAKLNGNQTFTGTNIFSGILNSFTELIMKNKNNLSTVDTITGDWTLSFEDPEYIGLDLTTDSTITLPTPTVNNIGTKFTIFYKNPVYSVDIITGNPNRKIRYFSTYYNSWQLATVITISPSTTYYIEFVCVGFGTGVCWCVSNESLDLLAVAFLNKNQTFTGDNTFSGTNTFINTINGTITNADNILTTSDNSSGTYYLPFVKTGGTNNKPLYIDDSTTPLTYNPNTSTLTAIDFYGTNFYGLASNATTATNSNYINITSDNSNITYYLTFSDTTGYSQLYIDSTTTPLSYNPSTSTLTALIFSGTSTNSDNILTTSDNTNGTYFLPFVKTGGTGNKPLFIDDATTPLTYNPSTGLLQTFGLQVVNKNILSNCLEINDSNYTSPSYLLTTSSPEYIYLNSSSQGFNIKLPAISSSNIGLKFSIFCNTPFLSQVSIFGPSYNLSGNVAYNTFSSINMIGFQNTTGLVCANYVEIVCVNSNTWAIIGGSADVFAIESNIISGLSNTFIDSPYYSPYLSTVNFNNSFVNHNNPTGGNQTITYNNTAIDYNNTTIDYNNPTGGSQTITYNNTDIDYNNPVGGDQTITYNNTYINHNNPTGGSQTITYNNTLIDYVNPVSGDQTINFNTTTINFNNPTIGATYDQTINFLNTTTEFLQRPIVREQYLSSSKNPIIEVDYTLTSPYLVYYPFYCSGGVEIYITLPTATVDNIGISFTFVRVQTSSPNYYLYSVTSNIYGLGGTGPTDVIVDTGDHITTITSLPVAGGGYGWFITNTH